MNSRTTILAGLGCAALLMAEGGLLAGFGSETMRLVGQSMDARAGWGSSPHLTVGVMARDGVELARTISAALGGR